MKELIKLLLETLIIGVSGAAMKIIFAIDDVPKQRQIRIFIGSVILSTLVGYGISFTTLPKVYFIASVAATALLAESIIKLILKKVPIILSKSVDKKFDIDENVNQ